MGDAARWRRAGTRRLGAVGGVVALTTAGALVAPADAAAALRVVDQDGATIATYGSMNCEVRRGAGFTARRVVRGWRLVIRINPFRGYRTYEVAYGDSSPADFYFDREGPGPVFSNVNRPDPDGEVRLTLGGALRFTGSRRRRSVGLAFPIAYDREDEHARWVRVTGTARCR